MAAAKTLKTMKKNTLKSNMLNTCKILATSIIIFSCKKDDVSATVMVYDRAFKEPRSRRIFCNQR
jgi:hypothetical protein